MGSWAWQRSCLPPSMGKARQLRHSPAGPPEYVDRILAAVRPDDPSAPLEDDDVAVVVATSGVNGRTRGVLLPGSALIASAKATDTRLGGPSRWVMALPAHHVAGLQVLVRAHLSGIPPIPLDTVGGAGHFSAQEFANATRAARAIADSDGAQLRTALVPTQLARIVELGPAAADALGAYDTILIGGAAAAYGLVARATSLGARIVTTYGMTETSGGCVYDGTPLAGVAVRIVDADDSGVGRIELAGPTVARGYRLRPELTEAAFASGMHRTSDRGRIDQHNRLVVVGRVDDVVQVGGINVSVAAVEGAVQEHPMVAEAAVVAVADDQWGSKITAFVVANGLGVSERSATHRLHRGAGSKRTRRRVAAARHRADGQPSHPADWQDRSRTTSKPGRPKLMTTPAQWVAGRDLGRCLRR